MGGRLLTCTIAVAVLVGLAAPIDMQPVHADDSSVVISEILYKPLVGDGEFIEITNAATTSVDMSGWTVSDGIELTVGHGTVLGAGERVVFALDLADFETDHGFAAAAAFTSGSLANSSDTLVLSDALGTVIDTVTYEDSDPWPPGPDDRGTSLELADVDAPNDDPTNWAESSEPGGTPGTINSAELARVLPRIEQVQPSPTRPQPGEDVVVSAQLDDADTASLAYRLDFGNEVVIPLLDDSASPGGANDGVYGARIPGQHAGTLIRYRIEGANAFGTAAVPAAIEAADYRGVVVVDPARASAVPVIEYWMPDSVYKDVLDNHRRDDFFVDAVLAYDGEVWDNVQMRIRGGNSRAYDHPSWNVEFPDGPVFEMPGHTTTGPVDEFNLQWDAFPSAATAWDVARSIGFPAVDYFPIRVYRNGDFWGMGSYGTALDGTWRDNNGIGDANVYKAVGGMALERQLIPSKMGGGKGGLEVSEGDDDGFVEVWEFANLLDADATKAQYEGLLDELNVPEVINYLAFIAWTKHWDSSNHNWYLVNDEADTDRWSVLPWDLDNVFDRTHGVLVEELPGVLPERVLAHPEFQEMYYRRLASLIEQFPLPTSPVEIFSGIYDPIAAELAEDYAKWHQDKSPAQRRDLLVDGAQHRADIMAARTGGTPGRPIPLAQSKTRPIVVSEVQYAPAPGGVEFIELTNTSADEAFDLSEWFFEGLDTMIQPGTVLLPGQQVVIVSDFPVFRDQNGPTFVAGELGAGLADRGGEIILVDRDGVEVDRVEYGVSAPWPAGTNGTGFTLELTNPALDNALPASWRTSSTFGGSPGAPPADTRPQLPPPGPGVILNEYNAVANDARLKSGGSDPVFGTALGNGGDWFELVVVESGLDLRGWSFHWSDDDASGSLTASDDPALADLPAGSLITIARDVPDDLTLDPGAGDWSMNLRPGSPGSGALVEGEPLEVSNSNWQLVVVDSAGLVRFGPVGEGASGLSGVGGDEVARLEDNPSRAITPASGYDDATESTFGSPNEIGGGSLQDFSALRAPEAPLVLAGPFDAEVAVGDSVDFEISTVGSSPLTIQWRRDGSVIPGANSARLLLTSVTAADNGATFDAVVTNSIGVAASSAATLTVDTETGRVTDGIEALWLFLEGEGAIIHDVAGSGTPTDLTIANPNSVVWLPGGGISIAASADIFGPSTKLVDRTIATDEFTMEFWVDPLKAVPDKSMWLGGMFSSRDDRNIVLAQGFLGADPTDSVRTKFQTAPGGQKSLNSPARAMDGTLAHVVLTRAASGSTAIYVDGVKVAGAVFPGRLPWVDHPFHLAGAGNLSPSSAFKGQMRLAAYYSRSLSIDEVARNFRVGPIGEPPAPVAPVIVSQPTPITVTEGHDATFQVAATGTPRPEFQWRRNATVIPGATDSTLILPAVSLADDGAIFDVAASNSAGSTTSVPVVLTVEPVPAVPPSFAVQPVAVSVRTGADAVFTVAVSGSPTPTLQWRRDGTPIPGATNPTLTLATLSTADDGAMIDVVATNSEGSITATPVMLSVVDTPRVAFVASTVPAPNRDRPVIARLSASGFDVTVFDDSTVDPAAVAGHDLVIVSSSVVPNELADTLAGLTIPMLSWEAHLFDELGWSTAGNREGPAATTTIDIVADHAITTGLRGTVQVVTSGVHFSIGHAPPDTDVLARPTGSLFDALVAIEAGDHLADGAVANARGVAFFFDYPAPAVATDAGWQLFDNAISWLLDTGSSPPAPPVVTSQPSDAAVAEGQDATFTVETTGSPEPDIQWRRNGSAIPGATDRVLLLPAVSLADDGTIIDVVATNTEGTTISTTATLTVTVTEDPIGVTVVGTPTVTVASVGDTVDITWEPVADSALSQVRYRGDGTKWNWDQPTAEHSATKTGLTSGAYTIEVRVLQGGTWQPWTTVQIVVT